jgi:hypothetical protein
MAPYLNSTRHRLENQGSARRRAATQTIDPVHWRNATFLPQSDFVFKDFDEFIPADRAYQLFRFPFLRSIRYLL